MNKMRKIILTSSYEMLISRIVDVNILGLVISWVLMILILTAVMTMQLVTSQG